MALTVTRTYGANTVLTEAQLDAAFDSIEAKFNSTLIAGAEIQSSAIEASHLASNAVTLTKLIDGVLSADASGRAKMADGFINAAKIADGAITQAKRASLGQQVSSGSGVFTNNSGTEVDITNLSVSITTTGRPVMILMINDNAGGVGYVGASGVTTTSVSATLRYYRDTTEIAEVQTAYWQGPSSGSYAAYHGSGPVFIDIPAAGTYTYKATIQSGSTSITATVRAMKLVAFEL